MKDMMGIEVYFKGGNTIKNLLVVPKDKDTITQKSGLLYRCKCAEVSVRRITLGSLQGPLGKRLKEHLRALPPFYNHANIKGHQTSVVNFTTVGRESHKVTRTIKDTINIRINDATLNRNIGKYQMLHIWNEILFSAQDLKLKDSLTLSGFSVPSPTLQCGKGIQGHT